MEWRKGRLHLSDNFFVLHSSAELQPGAPFTLFQVSRSNDVCLWGRYIFVGRRPGITVWQGPRIRSRLAEFAQARGFLVHVEAFPKTDQSRMMPASPCAYWIREE